MLERYWRMVLISKVVYEDGGVEYRVLYNRNMFLREPTVFYFDTTSDVVKHLIAVPHNERGYVGFDKHEMRSLEHVIEGTIGRRNLAGFKKAIFK